MEDLVCESSIPEDEQNDGSFDQSSYDPVAGNFTKKAASVDEVFTIKREAAVQAGGCALETAACTYGTRLLLHGIIIDDDKLEFWYYDSTSGYLCTKQTLSLFRDFSRVAAVIVGFARGDAAQWGALPSVVSPLRPNLTPLIPPQVSREPQLRDVTTKPERHCPRHTEGADFLPLQSSRSADVLV